MAGTMFDAPRREVSFAACSGRYYRGGTPDGTPLLLVHGGGGHVGWWADVVPRLGTRFDLIVPDLSGHGESEHRDDYTPELWPGELAAILSEEDEPSSVSSVTPWVVGSASAWRPATPRHRCARPRVGPLGFYPRVSGRFTDASLHATLSRVARPVGIIHGQTSVVASADSVGYVASRIGRRVPSIVVADAHHHVPLDRPEACADAVARMVDTLTVSARSTGDTPTSAMATRKR